LQPHARNHDANTGVRSVKISEADRKRGFRIEISGREFRHVDVMIEEWEIRIST